MAPSPYSGQRLYDVSNVFSLLLFGAIFGFIVSEYGHRLRKFQLRSFRSSPSDAARLIRPEGGAFLDQPYPSPPGKYLSDSSKVLNFAVIGNDEPGMSILSNHLANFDEIFILPHELCLAKTNQTDHAVEVLHDRLNDVYKKEEFTIDGRRIKTGLSCAEDLGSSNAVASYADGFPHTQFIVALWHPVLWFQVRYVCLLVFVILMRCSMHALDMILSKPLLFVSVWILLWRRVPITTSHTINTPISYPSQNISLDRVFPKSLIIAQTAVKKAMN